MSNAILTAIIPTRESDLYATYGVDITETIDPEVQDMQPVEWIELGDWPRDDDGDVLVTFDAPGISQIDDLVPGYRFDWATLMFPSREYATVAVEKL